MSGSAIYLTAATSINSIKAGIPEKAVASRIRSSDVRNEGREKLKVGIGRLCNSEGQKGVREGQKGEGQKGVSVQILTYRYPFIARLTKAARRFGNLGSFLAWVARRRS